MSRHVLSSLVTLCIATLAQVPLAHAQAITKRVLGSAGRGDLILSCDPSWTSVDYAAETASRVILTDPYTVARGADMGLVHMMDQAGRPVQVYVVPYRLIKGVVKTKFSKDQTDRVDLVFTQDALILIDTSFANTGIFTISDIYEIPMLADGAVDSSAVQQNDNLAPVLEAGLAFYCDTMGSCGSNNESLASALIHTLIAVSRPDQYVIGCGGTGTVGAEPGACWPIPGDAFTDVMNIWTTAAS